MDDLDFAIKVAAGLESRRSLWFKCATTMADIYAGLERRYNTLPIEPQRMALLFMRVLMNEPSKHPELEALRYLVEASMQGCALLCNKEDQSKTILMFSVFGEVYERPLLLPLTEKDSPEEAGAPVRGHPGLQGYILYPHSPVCICTFFRVPIPSCPLCHGTKRAKSLFGHGQLGGNYEDSLMRLNLDIGVRLAEERHQPGGLPC